MSQMLSDTELLALKCHELQVRGRLTPGLSYEEVIFRDRRGLLHNRGTLASSKGDQDQSNKKYAVTNLRLPEKSIHHTHTPDNNKKRQTPQVHLPKKNKPDSHSSP